MTDYKKRIEDLAKALYNTGFVDGQNYAENETKDEAFLARAIEQLEALLHQVEAETKIGWQIELPDLPYFQIECTGTTADRYWKSPIYDTKNLPAVLTHREES